MIYLFLAEGFEEAEALVPLDILRRAGLAVQTVGVQSKNVLGAHGISVKCDITRREAVTENLEMILLPGGMPGTANLAKSASVARYIDYAFDNGLYVGAICAAPSILGQRGLLAGRRVTCYPGYEGDCAGAQVTGSFIETDGKLITAKGMGVALEFGLKIVETLKGTQEAQRVKAAVMCR